VIVATVTLAGEDRSVWGEHQRSDAVYVHRLIVARRAAGRGLGAAILRAVAQRARDRGYRVLRLDCVGHNKDLVNYYCRLGFSPVG
jgi:GNAT superfamily N-acetyltransferase